MTEHRRIKAFGRVHGVFFRASCKEFCDQRGIRGFVRNQPDGSVLIEAEGEPKALDELEAWCQQGPEHAAVTAVTTTPGKMQNYGQFSIE